MQANICNAFDIQCYKLYIEQIAKDCKELAAYFSLTEAEEQTILASHAQGPCYQNAKCGGCGWKRMKVGYIGKGGKEVHLSVPVHICIIAKVCTHDITN